MKKLRTILVTAALAFSLGAFAEDFFLQGHPNLQKARQALNEADHWVNESIGAHEKIWGVQGGHGHKAKEFIAKARRELDLAAEWVNTHPRR